MIGQPPPYALASPVFRFRALAQHAGRASLGGDREVALACFAIARIAAAMLPPFLLAPADSMGRAGSTRQWLTSLNLGAAARASALAAIEAVAGGNRKTASDAISRLVDSASAGLDQSSIAEMRELVTELSGATNNSKD